MRQLHSEILPNRLKGALVLPLFLTGTGWLLSVSSAFPKWKAFFAAGGLLYIFFSFFLLQAKTIRLVNTLIFLAAIHYGYLFLESGAYIHECYLRSAMNISVFDKPCAVFDPALGYRWVGTMARNTRILYGKVVADTKFAINQQGFISRQNYSNKKVFPFAKRYIVFGDSFTAATNLHTSWPDRTTTLRSEKMKQPCEFYSFAVSGGGLANWHAIFFKNIVPHFEFDGLILAVYGNDLSRNFSILDMDATGGYFGRFAAQPSGLLDYKTNYSPHMKKIFRIMSNREIDKLAASPYKIKRWTFAPPNAYALGKIWDSLSVRINMITGEVPFGYLKSSKSLAFTDIAISLGEEKAAMLDEILTWCRQNKKEVLLIYIPSLQDLLLKTVNTRWVSIIFSEIAGIAEHYKVPYYDGSLAFDGLSQTELRKHWLLYDGHWNQAGSDRFASALGEFLKI